MKFYNHASTETNKSRAKEEEHSEKKNINDVHHETPKAK